MKITNASFATVLESSGDADQHRIIAERTVPKTPCTPKGLAVFFEGKARKGGSAFVAPLDVSDPKGESKHYDITVTPNADGSFEHCEPLLLTLKRLGTYKAEVTLDGEITTAFLEVSLRES